MGTRQSSFLVALENRNVTVDFSFTSSVCQHDFDVLMMPSATALAVNTSSRAEFKSPSVMTFGSTDLIKILFLGPCKKTQRVCLHMMAADCNASIKQKMHI